MDVIGPVLRDRPVPLEDTLLHSLSGARPLFLAVFSVDAYP